jgi:hypothetical protein
MSDGDEMSAASRGSHMADITTRLRQYGHTGEPLLLTDDDILEEAASEIERLREAIRRLAEQDATLSLLCKRDGSCVVTVTMDGTLTDEERAAIEVCATHWQTAPASKILRGLLERLG